jgi:MFS family permease
MIAARSLQGFAGAIVSPATLSIITSAFPEGPERNRALGTWGALGALGASSGALLGGILTQLVGWQAIFAINVPLGALVIALGLRAVPRAGIVEGRRHFDFAGAALVTGALLMIAYAIVRSDTVGWGSAEVVGPLAAGLGMLGAFLLVEARLSPAPLVPLSIFRLRNLRASNAVVVLLYAAVFPQWFFLTLYMQQVLHYSAIDAGLGFLPMTLAIFAGSTLAPRAVARFGARRVITTGLLTSAAGGLLLSGIAPGDTYLGAILAGGVLSALGMGLSLVPATIAAMEGVTPHESGLASGLLNTSRLVGGALGLAVLSAIAAGQEHGVVPVAQGMTDGFGIAFEVGSALCLLGAATAALLLRATGAERSAAAPERPSRAEPSARSERAREETELLAA